MKTPRLSLTIVIAVLCVCGNINAQPSFRRAVTAGISTSHPKEFDRFMGGEIGVKGECVFPKNFYLSTALSIANRGWNMPVYDLGENLHKWECDVYYLEVPISVGYKYALSNTSDLFCELGPYLALGL